MSVSSDAVNSRPRTTSHRFRKILILLLASIGALTVGVSTYLFVSATGTTDDATLEAHVVNLAPRVSGQVLRVLVEENQSVKEGQLLVEIDPADYQVKVAQAEAALKSARRRQETAHVRARVARVTTRANMRGAISNVEMSRSNIEKARTQVETASRLRDINQTRIAAAESQRRSAELTLNETRSQARAAHVQVTKSRQDFERAQKLVALEASPRELLEHSQAAYDAAVAQAEAADVKVTTAQSRIQEATANIATARQQLQQSESQISESQAHVHEVSAQTQDFESRVDLASSAPQQVQAAELEAQTADSEAESAQAALRQARLNLQYTRIVAPRDGRVSRRLAEPGSYAQVGQPLMAEVSHEMWVVANFRETDLKVMKVGQKATVRVDAYPGKRFAAHIDSLQPGSGSRFALLPPENASGNWVKVVQRVPVKLLFDEAVDGDFNLEPGMSVRVAVRR